MKVNVLSSGSDANVIAVTIDSKTILIDVGKSQSHTEKLLLDAGIAPLDIQAIFITHAHGDHAGGIGFASKYHIPVFATEGEWQDIKPIDDELTMYLTDESDPYARADIIFDTGGYNKWFQVGYFNVNHNSYDPVGYTVETKEKKASICLDTGYVCDSMINAMIDSDIYVIEANYDENMLKHSTYPESLKKRISGEVGHLSNDQTANALSKLVQGRGEEIHLVHLSNENNLPALARMTVERKLLERKFNNGKHYFLNVN